MLEHDGIVPGAGMHLRSACADILSFRSGNFVTLYNTTQTETLLHVTNNL